MSMMYRVSDGDEELGPVDIATMQGMFFRGSISNKARFREDGSSKPWQMITAEFPSWGKGRDTARMKRSDQRRIARAARPPKRFRSRPLGWCCFVAASLLWIIPFAFVYWMSHVANMNRLHKVEEEKKQTENMEELRKSHPEIMLPYPRAIESSDDTEKDKAWHEATESAQGLARTFLYWISLPGSAFLFWLGRRLTSVSAEDLLAKDARPPVVYFRSFQDDQKFEKDLFGSKKYRTEEEKIVKQLRRIGPVIAIGDPKETIPLAGASRLYAANDSWHAIAEKLLASAALVVYRFGASPGFVWELKRGRSQIQPERCVFLIPPSDNVFYATRYAQFCEQMNDVLKLPETPDSSIVSFGQDWTAEEFAKGDFYERLREFVSSRIPPTSASPTSASPAEKDKQQALLAALQSSEPSTPHEDYSKMRILQAGYAAIVYAVISVATIIFGPFNTPSIPTLGLAAIALGAAVVFGLLVFGIFKKSRVVITLMIVLVVGIQLCGWVLEHSFSGIVLSLVVTVFLLRGAKAIFGKHREISVQRN